MLESVISNSNRVPGLYLRMSFGVGARSSAQTTKRVLLFGNKLSSAPAPLETETPVFGIDDAATKVGRKSELYMECVAAFTAWPNATVSVLPVEEADGTAATGTIEITGSAATRGNTLRTWLYGRMIQTGIAVGDDPTDVAANHVADINDDPDLPVSAANVAGLITLTFAHEGTRGNHVRYRSELVDSAGGLTASRFSAAYFSSGATSDDPQNAIDAIEHKHDAYLAIPYDNVDQSQIAKFVDWLEAQDEPEVGNRSVGVCAETVALATATATPAANNAERLQVAWMRRASWTPGMIAAAVATTRARREGINPAHNHNGEELVGMPGPTKGDKRPEDTELMAAINAGLTPVITSPDGTVRILKSITSKFQDASGNPDYRVHDTHKVAVCDTFANDLEVRVNDTHAKNRAGAEADYPDGVPEGITTEELLKDTVVTLQREYQSPLGRLQNVEALIANTIIDPPTEGGRFNGSIPLDVIELFHQGAFDVRQVG